MENLLRSLLMITSITKLFFANIANNCEISKSVTLSKNILHKLHEGSHVVTWIWNLVKYYCKIYYYKYLPSMKLDGYSFKLCQERVDKCHTQGFFPLFHLSTPLYTTDKWLTLKYDESLTCLGCPTVSLTYPHIPDKARMNNHQASYLVSICLIFSFILAFSLPCVKVRLQNTTDK